MAMGGEVHGKEKGWSDIGEAEWDLSDTGSVYVFMGFITRLNNT